MALGWACWALAGLSFGAAVAFSARLGGPLDSGRNALALVLALAILLLCLPVGAVLGFHLWPPEKHAHAGEPAGAGGGGTTLLAVDVMPDRLRRALEASASGDEES